MEICGYDIILPEEHSWDYSRPNLQMFFPQWFGQPHLSAIFHKITKAISRLQICSKWNKINIRNRKSITDSPILVISVCHASVHTSVNLMYDANKMLDNILECLRIIRNALVLFTSRERKERGSRYQEWAVICSMGQEYHEEAWSRSPIKAN